MCQRFSQYRDARQYWSLLPIEPLPLTDFAPCYNVAPGMPSMLLQQAASVHVATKARWGYQHGRPSMVANIAIDRAVVSAHWKPLWQHGRIIVPADGWYEWVGPDNDKQPYFIYRQNRRALWLAALWGADGFTLVSSSESGVLDPVEPAPIVFEIDDALRWLHPEISNQEAAALAARAAAPSADWRWHPVTQAMRDTGYQRSDAISPVPLRL